jgi:hypothetical protein
LSSNTWSGYYDDSSRLGITNTSGTFVPVTTSSSGGSSLVFVPTQQAFVKGPPSSKKTRSPKQLRGSIFISHSKADLNKLVKPAARRIKAAGLDAYIASMRTAGKNPADKIVEAIFTSKAVYAIITHNVTDNQETRDWVLFEIGSAKSWGKKVFGWKTKEVTIPEPIRQITDYTVFDEASPKEVSQMFHDMWILAKSL